MIDQETINKLRRLMEAREARDIAKEKQKRTETEYRDIEAEVWELLEESAMNPPYKVDLGDPYGEVRFANRVTNYARIIDRDEALESLEQRALVDEFFEPKPVMQRFNEMVRDALERGDPLPKGVDFTPRRFMQITRQKD